MTSELLEGVDVKDLRPGSLVDVETESRHYYIECLGGEDIRISGHPAYCPQPVRAHVTGAIECGRRLRFLLNNDRPVTTTNIVSLHVDEPQATPPNSSPSVN